MQRVDIDDVPHLVDLLRTTFKEYQRRQRGPFLKQVERAAQIAKEARPDPEAQLQVPPAAKLNTMHLCSTQATCTS